MTSTIKLACLDMAGTTVRDDGAVIAAFSTALDTLEVNDPTERQRMLDYVNETMGMSKIVVFRSLLGDDTRAQEANHAFEDAYAKQIATGAVAEIPGALDMIRELRERDVKVALLTGFSKPTQDALVDALGWRHEVDLLVCPSDAGRGRPYPDMILYSLIRLEVDAVSALAVAGDTAADVLSGRRAGAPIVVGVLTGADGRDRLKEAGATTVLDSIVELPATIESA
jgi:phosphoglycolate phosphatase